MIIILDYQTGFYYIYLFFFPVTHSTPITLSITVLLVLFPRTNHSMLHSIIAVSP